MSKCKKAHVRDNNKCVYCEIYRLKEALEEIKKCSSGPHPYNADFIAYLATSALKDLE